MPVGAGVVAGLLLTWLWYAPNADLAATLLLGDWLPVISVAIIGLTVILALAPSPSVVQSAQIPVSGGAAHLVLVSAACRHVSGHRQHCGRRGRADRPNYFDLSRVRVLSGTPDPRGVGLADLHHIRGCCSSQRCIVSSLHPALERSAKEQVPPWLERSDVFVLLWFLFPFVVATLSTHREVRSVLPLMPPSGALSPRESCWGSGDRWLSAACRRDRAVCLLLTVQFAVLNLSCAVLGGTGHRGR